MTPCGPFAEKNGIETRFALRFPGVSKNRKRRTCKECERVTEATARANAAAVLRQLSCKNVGDFWREVRGQILLPRSGSEGRKAEQPGVHCVTTDWPWRYVLTAAASGGRSVWSSLDHIRDPTSPDSSLRSAFRSVFQLAQPTGTNPDPSLPSGTALKSTRGSRREPCVPATPSSSLFNELPIRCAGQRLNSLTKRLFAGRYRCGRNLRSMVTDKDGVTMARRQH
jgi:hypothetical protein